MVGGWRRARPTSAAMRCKIASPVTAPRNFPRATGTRPGRTGSRDATIFGTTGRDIATRAATTGRTGSTITTATTTAGTAATLPVTGAGGILCGTTIQLLPPLA